MMLGFERLQETFDSSDRTFSPRSRAPSVVRRSFRLRQTTLHGLGGLVFGYVVLHPVAMVVFARFGAHSQSRGSWGVLEQMANFFAPAMLPMGLVFGLFGLLLGALNGYYQSVVGYQRDDLARELRLKEQQNHRLRELELGKKRMTRFLLHEFKNHLGCVVGYTEMLLGRSRGRRWDQQDVEDLQLVRRSYFMKCATRWTGTSQGSTQPYGMQHGA